MPKINLIGWVWYSDLFWQFISCYKLSSCHEKIFTSEIDWEIANITVSHESVWLVEFEILLYFDILSVVTSCQAVTKKFDFTNSLVVYISKSMPNLSLIGWVLGTIPDGRMVGWPVGGEWIIVLSSDWLGFWAWQYENNLLH